MNEYQRTENRHLFRQRRDERDLFERSGLADQIFAETDEVEQLELEMYNIGI